MSTDLKKAGSHEKEIWHHSGLYYEREREGKRDEENKKQKESKQCTEELWEETFFDPGFCSKN